MRKHCTIFLIRPSQKQNKKLFLIKKCHSKSKMSSKIYICIFKNWSKPDLPLTCSQRQFHSIINLRFYIFPRFLKAKILSPSLPLKEALIVVYKQNYYIFNNNFPIRHHREKIAIRIDNL